MLKFQLQSSFLAALEMTLSLQTASLLALQWCPKLCSNASSGRDASGLSNPEKHEVGGCWQGLSDHDEQVLWMWGDTFRIEK
jgi:hypothetical protein